MDTDNLFHMAAVIAGGVMREHSAAPRTIAQRALDVAVAIYEEGQSRGLVVGQQLTQTASSQLASPSSKRSRGAGAAGNTEEDSVPA